MADPTSASAPASGGAPPRGGAAVPSLPVCFLPRRQLFEGPTAGAGKS